MLEIESESSRSDCEENSFLKRLWTCRNRLWNEWINEWMNEWTNEWRWIFQPVYKYALIRYCRFSQRCCWRFKSSGMYWIPFVFPVTIKRLTKNCLTLNPHTKSSLPSAQCMTTNRRGIKQTCNSETQKKMHSKPLCFRTVLQRR